MGELFNFKVFQQKKERETNIQDPRMVVAIYRSVVHFVHMYLDEIYEDPMDHLTTHSDLKSLYKNDRGKFLETFAALIQYWELPPNSDKELPYNKEFDCFPTIGDLCMYIEKRVKDL
ncbi:hypothetical protein SAMN05192559_10371 [Halobacillus karajensis]|uniref:Uncharacterized protein n=1 Tax=Halobacillus karajensis TaxID=195088 RepID=A0A024P2U6_9BACI|nr:hypothetical protein [Halobacillus karajensis]CDQ19985.1 hypothetical protein BN982_02292 [Halobacillus karajensis]CDQ22445.1 hypothetical protein BN983_00653 [Halobacillus karajensis]CDQ28288.1 hypothetical protein BN981_02582 [Halobacillus karajensis]SEH68673.1 hypothetical protein SAMN05192559_10371 [Halobacillus karajensis]